MKVTSVTLIAVPVLVVSLATPAGRAQDAKDGKPLAEYSSHKGSWVPIDFHEGDKSPKRERVIRTAAELDSALTRQEIKDEERKTLLTGLGRETIDWDKEMLVAIHGGPKPRGYRHRVTIESIKSQGNVLSVTYAVVKTDCVIVGSDGGKVVVIIPRFDGNVRFVTVSKNAPDDKDY